jgi:hypothetical protein
VYDSTVCEWKQDFQLDADDCRAFVPFSRRPMDVAFSVGLYVAITTTADVNVSASYR